MGIVLHMPKDLMFKNINEKGIVDDINVQQWRGKARVQLQELSNFEIVTTYNI